jgi:hypothetical protein
MQLKNAVRGESCRRMSRVLPHNRRQESPPTITSRHLRLGTRFAFLGLCLALLAAGCGKNAANRAAISGRVELDGHPLERGSILLASLDGVQRTVTGAEIVDGEYRLTRANGPAVGWNRVEIRAMRTTGKMVSKPYAPHGTMVGESVEAIPAQFNSASTLKVDVRPGGNSANFEVDSK